MANNCGEHLANCRQIQHTEHRNAVVDHREQVRIQWNTGGERLGAVDWIDNPLASRGSLGRTVFFAQDGVVRKLCRNGVADQAFRSLVGCGYR